MMTGHYWDKLGPDLQMKAWDQVTLASSSRPSAFNRLPKSLLTQYRSCRIKQCVVLDWAKLTNYRGSQGSLPKG